MSLFADTETLKLELEPELMSEINEAAKAYDLKPEIIAMTAIKRLLNELKSSGKIVATEAQPALISDEDDQEFPVIIHLSGLEHRVMTKAAQRYGSELSQLTKYGLFHAEGSVGADGINGAELLDEIHRIQNPAVCFAELYPEQIEAEEKEAEETAAVH